MVVAGALFVMLLDGNLPTPLYAVYQERFGFSDTTLTLIFAVYAVMLIPSLLVFGQLSDRIGRRPVIVGGLIAAAIGLVLLAAAKSTTALLVARAVQGVAWGPWWVPCRPPWWSSSRTAITLARRWRPCWDKAEGVRPGRWLRARWRSGRRRRRRSAIWSGSA